LNAANSSEEKRQPMATWYVALSPMITLWLFGATALHVRLVFGQWPSDAVDHAPTVLLGLNIFVFAGDRRGRILLAALHTRSEICHVVARLN
jgi:hypothetical protein